MAGNSQRRGATRKSESKKPRSVGSGGVRRRGLEGKGPTPRAEDRPGHVAYRTKKKSAARQGTAAGARRSPAHDSSLVVGRNAVRESLLSGMGARRLLVQSTIESDPRVTDALEAAHARGIVIVEQSRDQLDRIAEGLVHQGVVLEAEPYEYADLADLRTEVVRTSGRIVVCDGITDPGNLGAIVRSSLALGAAGVVISKRRSAEVNPTVWRASAGALAHLPIARVANISRAVADLEDHGITAVALVGNTSTSLQQVDVTGIPVAVVVGAEGAGVSRLVAERCSWRASIPMDSRAESLNVSVAAAIALYELGRRGGTPRNSD